MWETHREHHTNLWSTHHVAGGIRLAIGLQAECQAQSEPVEQAGALDPVRVRPRSR